MLDTTILIVLAVAIVLVAFLYFRVSRTAAIVAGLLLVLAVLAFVLFPRFGMGVNGLFDTVGDFFKGLFGGGQKEAAGGMQLN